MDKDNNLTQVTEENLAYVEKELEQTSRPLTLAEIAQKLAFQKTANQRVQDVLKYDPAWKYEIGDQIYREYDEALTVSSKTVEHFKGAVVLKVLNKLYYKDFQCEMLEVDYTGGGLFRKYIDYMKKTKTQVLLPSNCEGKGLAPEKMDSAEDPRLSELPMTDRDMKTLEKNLHASLSKSARFFSWNDHWQLSKNQVAIPEEKIKAIEKHIQETIAGNLSLISPSAAFTRFLTDVCGTGEIDKAKYLEAVKIHQQTLDRALFSHVNKTTVIMPGGSTASASSIGELTDLKTLPSFSIRKASLSEVVVGNLGSLVSLALWLIAPFAAAYVRFLKYDVR